MKFQPGQSGNPAGKPKGAKDKRSALRALIEKNGRTLIVDAIAMAKDEPSVMVALLNRLVPALRPESTAGPIAMDSTQAADVQARQVLAEIAAGRVSVDDGHTLLATIERRSAIEREGDVARLVAALAQKAGIELPASLRVRTATQPEGTLQ